MARKYGKGSIRRERNGRYRVSIPDGKGGQTHLGIVDTIEDAEGLRDAGLIERGEVGYGLTLRRYGEAWLRRIADQRDYRSVESRWNGIVLHAPFADMPIESLTRSEVYAWTKELPRTRARRTVLRNGKRTTVLTDRTISRQTGQHALGALRRCLAAAVLDGYLADNPAEGVPLPKWPKADRQHDGGRLDYLTAEQVEQLLGHPSMSDEQRVVFTIATHQGLRQGEIAGLDWSSVDWSGRGLWVVASWTGKTKTDRARWQALLERTEIALRGWWEAHGRPAQGPVFPSPFLDGRGRAKPYARGHDWGWSDRPQAKCCLLGVPRRCGLSTEITFHGLRDTTATHLLSGTWGTPWPIERVRDHLGHTSVQVTERRYAHVTRTALRAAADATPAPRRAANMTGGDRGSDEESSKIVGAPGMIRTSDRRLRKPREAEPLQPLTDVSARLRHVHGDALDQSRALLERVAAGEPVAAHQQQALASAVLNAPVVRAAMRVLAGGPHMLDAAIELAETLLAHPTPARAKGGAA